MINMSQVKKIINPFNTYKGDQYNCIGCSPNNKNGIHLEFYADEDTVFSTWLPKVDFEGYNNVVHGGIQATLMDEVACWYIYAMMDTAGVTGRIDIRYHHPVYISTEEIKIIARLKSQKERLAVIETEIQNSNGKVCSSALVEYVLFPARVARVKYNYPGKQAFWEK
jgi:uncharacterized protein (TIGR00369 family)